MRLLISAFVSCLLLTMADSSRPDRPAYGADPIHKYGLLTPKFWHGMRLGDWWRLISGAQFKVSALGASTSVMITIVACFNSFFSALNGLFFGARTRKIELKAPPLFVLGHWRSGTTMLHELLIRDPENAYPTTYQCFAPHHFLVTESWVTPLIGWLLPKKRPMDNVATGWKRPQEDEFAICNLGQPTPYLCWAFPNRGPVHREYLTLQNLSEAERHGWIKTLKHFIRSLAVKDNRRLVLKSPPHTARVRTLLEAYPDAKFVHIVRDPLTVFPSTMRLWKSLCDVQGLQKPKAKHDWIEPYVLDNLAEMYQAFEADRGLIPPGQLAELRYEDLVADPAGKLEEIYDELNLGDFEQVRPALQEYLGETTNYKTNRYELPTEIEAKVRERWAPYFERYGYE